MLLGAMPEESGAAGAGLVTKARATDFSIAAIMARGANSKKQTLRAEMNSPPRISADGKSFQTVIYFSSRYYH